MSESSDISVWPPTNCEQVCIWLNARSDGECTPAQDGWLAEHLQDCRPCSQEWAAVEGTRLAFKNAKLSEPADFEREAIERALGPSLLNKLGWLALIAGAVGISILIATDIIAVEKTFELITVLLLYLGFGLLFLRVLLERIRTRRHDPYRHVKR
ncbi:MAG: hypothetical protein COB96_06545 [Planctomycetota bacterium]|nr:MAG: hypothetical protein COB96_06545 [Planctomycetota bacterium]